MLVHRHVLIASVGGVIEFFDFTLMLFLAPVIAKVFFPETQSSSLALLAVMSSFAAGYLCRPLGGVIFGHIGDRFGRKRAFLLTIVVMSLSTLLIGFLPGYFQWGLLSSLLLIALRIIQGISFGGDVGTIIPYVIEISPDKHKVLAGGVLLAIIITGTLLSSVTTALLQFFLSPAQMALFGWRILFMGAGVLGIIAIPLRMKLQESAVFTTMENTGKLARVPVLTLFRQYFKRMIAVFIFSSAMVVNYNYLFLLLPLHLEKFTHLNSTVIRWSNVFGSVLILGSILLFAHLADRRKMVRIIRCGLILSLCIVYPLVCFLFYDVSLSWWNILIIYGVIAVITGLLVASLYTYLGVKFPGKVRCSAVALVLNSNMLLSGILFALFTDLAIYHVMLPMIILMFINGLALFVSYVSKASLPPVRSQAAIETPLLTRE